MHDKFVAWFYSLESIWDEVNYNTIPYIVTGFILVFILIISYWVAIFLWGSLQMGFSYLWDLFKPIVKRVKNGKVR